MTKVYLFDWGDTLMVDFPGVPGRMCDWETVEAIEGAEEALKSLAAEAAIYIATGAADSTAADIKKAFTRVGLDRYISGYFCKANLGVAKGDPGFFPTILSRLGLEPNRVTMVGDSLEKDIRPALRLGIRGILFSDSRAPAETDAFQTIASLSELCRQPVGRHRA